MSDDTSASAAPVQDPRALAAQIYAAWRNAHLNNLPVEFFNRLEAASPELITAIAEHL
jgi:hypothetical protein